MREVLVTVTRTNEVAVTQREYDRARIASGYARTPRADKLAARFGLPWARLVSIVREDENAARAIARAAHVQDRSVLTRTEAIAALRAAARHLRTDQLSPAEYERARRDLDETVHRRRIHGRPAAALPALAVIRDKFEFAEIAATAGLTVPRRAEQALMPRRDAVALFIGHCGFVPRQLDLAWFARHHRIQLVDREHEPHRVAVASAREAAQLRGLDFPTSPPPTDWQQVAARDSSALAEARAQSPAARKSGYSLDEAREAIRRAFDLLGPGLALTQERYRALSTEHGLPSPSVIQRLGNKHGTSFGTLVREVAAERASATMVRPGFRVAGTR